MFKIAKSVMTIALLALVAVGATSSYFTDTETISSNTFSFGTLDMTLADESYAPIVLENLKPGDVIDKQIDIQNAGTIDFGSLKMGLENVSDDNGILGQIDASIRFVANSGTDQETTIDLGTMKVDGIYDLELIADASGNLIAGNSGIIYVSLSVPAELGNEYQSAAAGFDLVLNAEQIK